jgi:SnoaL-like domain
VTQTQPRQAWAHRDGKIVMNTLAPADWSIEAVIARAQITETFYRFGTGHDEARTDVVGSCFTANAVYEVAKGQGEAFTRFNGRAEIMERFTAIVAEQSDQRRHSISNVLVERLDGDTATAIAYSIVSVAADGLTLGATVFYTADLAKEADGVWRFSYFFIGMDAYAGEGPKAGRK